jgi:hypothetical protein
MNGAFARLLVKSRLAFKQTDQRLAFCAERQLIAIAAKPPEQV